MAPQDGSEIHFSHLSDASWAGQLVFAVRLLWNCADERWREGVGRSQDWTAWVSRWKR